MKTLSESEMEYVFKDRAECNLVTRNQHGEGNFTTETLYQAFKQRLISECFMPQIFENRVQSGENTVLDCRGVDGNVGKIEK